MTKREAAIISAYTGIMIGEFCDLHSYAEEILDQEVYTHHFISKSFCDLLKEKSECDFIKLNKNIV